MERILTVAAVAVVGTMLVIGARISGRLGTVQAQLERQTEVLSDAQEAAGSSESDPLSAAESPLAARMGRVAEALETLVADDQAQAGKAVISSQSMEDAALMLSYSPDPRLRQQTIAILGQLGGEKAEKRLLEILESDGNSQSQVLQALHAMGSERLEPLVMKILEDGTMQEMNSAVAMLSGILNRKNLPLVLEMLEELPSGNHSQANSIRQRIYSAMRNLGDPAACQSLLDAAVMETNGYAQREAIQALVACSTPAQLGMLVEALEVLGLTTQNHSASSQQQLISHFGQLGDPRTTPALLDLLDSPNRSVVNSTLQALGQLKDPLAAERLVEVANGPDNHAKQYLSRSINNGFPGIRKQDDGTYALADEKTLNSLFKARRRLVARLEKRYGALKLYPENKEEEENEEQLGLEAEKEPEKEMEEEAEGFHF